MQTENTSEEKPSFWSKVLKVTRDIGVVLGATIVTGALLASGFGALAAIAIGIGAGTGFGGITNFIKASCDISSGKNFKEALSEAFFQTGQDFISSAVGAISTACGLGVAVKVISKGGGQAASLGTKLFAGSLAGGTNASVSTAISTPIQHIQVKNEFEKLHGNLRGNEREEKYKEFLEERGLSSNKLVKNSFFNVAIGFISGGVGSKFQSSKDAITKAVVEGTKTQLRGNVTKALVTTAEASSTFTIGLTGTYLRNGHISSDELLQESANSFIGTYVGALSSRFHPREKAPSNNKALEAHKQHGY